MKKSPFLIVIVALLAALFALPVSAQNNVDFTPLTVPNFFNWGDKAISVYTFLSEIEGLVCEPSMDDDQNRRIDCSADDLEEEITYYSFFFTENERLYLVTSTVNYLGYDLTIRELFEVFAEHFSAIRMKQYRQGTFYDYYAADTDLITCGIIPKTTYVCIAMTEETEETLPHISLIYSDFEFARDLDLE